MQESSTNLWLKHDIRLRYYDNVAQIEMHHFELLVYISWFFAIDYSSNGNESNNTEASSHNHWFNHSIKL
jgi:hypothetical protein